MSESDPGPVNSGSDVRPGEAFAPQHRTGGQVAELGRLVSLTLSEVIQAVPITQFDVPIQNPEALPLNKLDPGVLERLAAEVLSYDNNRGIHLYGRSGQRQDGLDIVEFDTDDTISLYQVKRYQDMSPTKIHRIVKEYAGPPRAADYRGSERKFNPRRFVIVTSAPVESNIKNIDKLTELRVAYQGDLTIDIWGAEVLGRKLRVMPNIVCAIFGEAWARAWCGFESSADPPTAGREEFKADLLDMLTMLDAAARKGNLPAYLPSGADLPGMDRTVRVLANVRGDADERAGGYGRKRAYRLPADTDGRRSQPPQPWEEAVAEYERLVILADPGMGKSWLLRIYTHRLARSASAAIESSDDIPAHLIIPVPIRADTLAASPGRTLGEAAVSYLIGEGYLPSRSGPLLRERIAAGQVMLLIDALDEVPRAASAPGEKSPRKRLEDLLHDWASECIGAARCVLASRLAGYTGPPVFGAQEAELLPFSPDDARTAVMAWNLPAAAQEQVSKWLEDPAVAGMTRLPLLLTLVCSLAAREPHYGPLPETRAGLYEAVIWEFLSSTHRSSDRGAPNAATSPSERQELLRILARIAYAFASTPRGWVDQMPYNQLIEVISATGESLATLGGSASAALERLTAQAGILVPAANPAIRDQAYMFMHRTIAEYLVALYLRDLPHKKRMDIVADHQWFDPDWAEVIPMLASLLVSSDPDDVSDMITYFLTQRPDPLHRAFFFALRIITESAGSGTILTTTQEPILTNQIHRMLARPSTHDELIRTLQRALVWPEALTGALLAYLSDKGYGRRTCRALFNTLKCGHPNLYIAIVQFNWNVHGYAAAMRALAGRNSPEIVEMLLSFVSHESAGDVATGELAKHDSSRVIEGLLELLDSEEPLARRRAVEALTGRDSPAVRDGLLPMLWDYNAVIREDAVYALSRWRDSLEVTGCLLTLLGDENGNVRSAAAAVLSQSGCPGVIDALLARLADKRPTVRGSAAAALRERDVPGVAQALLALLSDKVGRVRAEAIHALAGRDSPEVVEALLARLTDEDSSVCISAVDTLAGLDSPEVRQALQARLTDAEEWVRRAADQALGGEVPPESDLKERQWQYVGTVPLATWSNSMLPRWTQYALEVIRFPARLTGGSRKARRNAVEEQSARDRLDSVTELLSHVSDMDWDVQWATAKILASRDDPRILIRACQPTLRAWRVDWRTTRDYLAKSTVDRIYLMLPQDARPKILRRLARITQ
jgi:HEAT repeat protein